MSDVPVNTVKVLSIQQPYAWLIVHADKDIENRLWPTRFRGRFLVHASKRIRRDDYEEYAELYPNMPPHR